MTVCFRRSFISKCDVREGRIYYSFQTKKETIVNLSISVESLLEILVDATFCLIFYRIQLTKCVISVKKHCDAEKRSKIPCLQKRTKLENAYDDNDDFKSRSIYLQFCQTFVHHHIFEIVIFSFQIYTSDARVFFFCPNFNI